MAANPQISTITIPALVIAFNRVQFINDELVVGKVLNVPCRDILFDNEDSWAIPVQDSGIFTGFDFELKQGQYLAQPSVDSFTVFRIRDKNSFNEWIINGTQEDLITSCATCCGSVSPVLMPGVADGSFPIRIPPCQDVDLTNASGVPYMVFGLPTLDPGFNYYPFGSYNNVNFTEAAAAGYSNTTLLLAFLNANFLPYTWTVSGSETLIATGGSIDDNLCLSIIEILPSP